MPNEAGIVQRDIASWNHDARNRLNVIIGYASLLETNELNRVQRGHVREIQAAAREIQSLLDVLKGQFLLPERPPSLEFRLDE